MTSFDASNPSMIRSSASRQSRRAFLAQTAAVAGAASLISSLDTPAKAAFVAPKARTRTPLGEGETIRMGIIGTGGMGTAHTGAFMNFNRNGTEKVNIVALCDVCKPRLDNAHKRCTDGQSIEVATYRKHEDLLARDDIHGVLIAAPEHWHAQLAMDALAAGKDVYLEKPMTLHLTDAVRLYETVKANPDLRLQVGTQMIMLPKYHRAREVIAAGGIGVPTMSQTSYCRNSKAGEWTYYNIDPQVVPGPMLDWDRWCGPKGVQPFDPAVYARWRRYSKYSTGIIGDLLVHVMTPLIMALDMGWPTRVVASGGHYVDKAMDNFDNVNLTIQFEKGHTMIVAGSTANEVGLETLIRGHQGNIYLNGRHCVVRPERIFVDDIDERTLEVPDIGNDQDQLRLDWLKTIRTRKTPASPVDLALRCMVIVDLATRSMWEGKAFAFDPSTLTASPA